MRLAGWLAGWLAGGLAGWLAGARPREAQRGPKRPGYPNLGLATYPDLGLATPKSRPGYPNLILATRIYIHRPGYP